MQDQNSSDLPLVWRASLQKDCIIDWDHEDIGLYIYIYIYNEPKLSPLPANSIGLLPVVQPETQCPTHMAHPTLSQLPLKVGRSGSKQHE